MTGYLTVCFSDWNADSFKRGVMRIRNGKRTEEPIHRAIYPTERKGFDYYIKPDPDFVNGIYKRCHRQLRVSLKVGDRLFFRTLWRGKPYLAGYMEIGNKVGLFQDPSCLADLAKSRLINFNLEITPELVKLIKPNLKDKRHFNQQVVSALGRNYIKLSGDISNYLTNLVNQYPNALAF